MLSEFGPLKGTPLYTPYALYTLSHPHSNPLARDHATNLSAWESSERSVAVRLQHPVLRGEVREAYGLGFSV